METLADRLKFLRKKRGYKSKSVAAEAIGMPYGTYQGYEYGTFPGRDSYKKISDHYKCSLLWLKEGTGDPFPDQSKTEVDGVNENISTYGKDAIQPKYKQQEQGPFLEFSIAEDLIIATKVLESKTHYATALHLNIRSFSSGVDDLKTLNNVVTRLEDLEGKFENLQLENKSLKDEVKELRDHGGGCAPTDLNQGDAAHTGTDDQKT